MSGIPQRRALGVRNDNVKSRLPMLSKLPVKDAIPVSRKRKVETSTVPGAPIGKKLCTDQRTTKPAVTARKVTAKPARATGVIKRGPVTAAKKPISATARGTKTARPAVKKPIGNANTKQTAPPGMRKPAKNGVKSVKPGWDLRGQILDLQASVSEKEEELLVVKETAQSHLEEKETLQTQVEILEGRIKEITRELEVKSGKYDLLQRETISMEMELSNTKATVERKEMVIKERDGEIRGLKQNIDEMTATIEDQNKKLIEAEETRKRLHNAVQELKTTLERREMVISDRDNEISNLNKTVEDLKAKIEEQHQELIEGEEARKSLHNTVQELKSTLERKEMVINDRDAEITNLNGTVEELNAKLEEQHQKLIEGEEMRKYLHNAVQELKGNIRVYCRVRPLLTGEEEEAQDFISFSEDQKLLELINLRDRSVNKTSKKLEFSFDHIFGPASTQSEVFSEISQLVQSALDGYNVCIFAYGQTGSGKTFTMEGPVRTDTHQEGMIPRAVGQIFLAASSLQDKGWQFEMEATFLEIYNEVIKDLLGQDSSKKPEIHMVGGKSKEVEVTNIEKYSVTSEGQVADLLMKAAKNRAVASTAYNERSSRSHSIFRLKITGRNSITGDSTSGTLNLVDLAGSERLPEAGYEKERLKEMKNINQSLSNLGKVIMALSNKDSHVPYRNCKLTHLLQDSLGGNSKTLMFVNVSPKEECFQETLCSLRFAVKVNNCNIGTAQKKVK
ncbi:uncharacterized protein [Apostichopus japonicus]|uniref:uncharacterized protein n=1 Tax=Stichopus japonicus TaxID=307972 RepID=UPI003AB21EF3